MQYYFTGEEHIIINKQLLLNSYRISNETLQDIWEKACQLVHKSDLISTVPGQVNSDNRMVASLSGNPPHFIEKKSKGQFVCSGVCHRFIAYKICEHIVAACQDSGNLSVFCNWWKCQKSGPNLDALALSGLPKGVAGNKGGVSIRSRRGKKTLKHQPIHIYDRVSTESVGGTSSTSQLLGQSTSQVPCQFNVPLYQGQLVQQGSLTGDTNYSPTTVGMQPSRVTPFQPHGNQPYFVKMLTKQIRVCAGCRLGFNNEKDIPLSPYNICIGHEEIRQITPSSGKTPFTTKTTAHYHANPSCIWMKNASFMPENIQIPPGVYEHLDQSNKCYLMDYFNSFLY